MSSNDVNRRDFHRLSVAALSGLIAGAAIGCGGDKPNVKPADMGNGPKATDITKDLPKKPEGETVAAVEVEKHLCRGLNSCKGKGGGESAGKNACAGQGECATVAEHSCGSKNDCKGFGGCGKDAGANECKGKGGCHVPLMDDAWKTVRARFEEKMKTDKKKFGDAPLAKKSA